ncbi:MAG: tRNA uridine-5-carboxymethylaminomethyl(34) synthesis GTPase MnmE [Simkaniaceae bacterium]
MLSSEFFSHSEDCIAAIATPPGEGGIAIVRLSGKGALQIANRMFSGPVLSYQSHTVHFGKFLGAGDMPIDEGLLIPMKAPNSFTGEDVVEFHCHGGSLISEKILSRALSLGARMAKPGEFTFRAFKNSKLDLTQAEAVQEAIAAKSTLALNAAQMHLEGRLSKKIRYFQQELTDAAATIEAWVDYPEEDLELETMQALLQKINAVQNALADLSRTFEDGQFLSTGYRLCLIGAPNVGKSSLMNILLGKDRAIVTDIAGTTRDLLEEDIRIGDLHFRLVDTAGIRETEEVIEREGIRRSKEAAEKADAVLLILDAAKGISVEEKNLIAALPPEKTLAVWNKVDISPPNSRSFHLPLVHQAEISALHQTGIEALKRQITALVQKNPSLSKEEVLITKRRHFEALSHAMEALERAKESLNTAASPEFIAIDLREALNYLSTIIGTNVSEDILSAIFSKFCVGK